MSTPLPRKYWLELPETLIPTSLQAGIGGHVLVAQTLVRRGIHDLARAQAFIDPKHYNPAPSIDLPDLSRAANRIEQAIQHQETILVWGDFDVDGQTSTTLLVEALSDLSAQVVFHIPVRESESHGIQIPFLKKIIDEYHPGLLLTCDTGVSEHDAVDYANQRGLDVVITDHHDLPPKLPNALATVNGNRLPENHPLRTLPGVGVAYKLIEELYRRSGIPQASHRYLDLVALGIVADVAEQTGDTRYLLQLGLDELRNTQRPGLLRLMESAKINPAQLTEENIGFGIGPRLNALGRLDNAAPIIEFLTSDDLVKINITAVRLEGLNERRKLLTDQIYLAALLQIEQDPTLLNYAALVIAHPDWHAGVIGIVASRLAERYHRPVILFNAPEDGTARGSARSIKGINISEAIANHKELLKGFGGHPMAAGLALPTEHIVTFRHKLSRTIKSTIGAKPMQAVLPIDAYLNFDELTLDLVDDLARLAPFGAGNPALIFATRNVKLVSHTGIGNNQAHRRLVVKDASGHVQKVLWWHSSEQSLPEGVFDIAYRISANTYKGERRLQIQWLDFRQETAPTHQVEFKPTAIKVNDYRQEAKALPILENLQTKVGIQIWAEGIVEPALHTVNRLQLTHQKYLALWTIPPGPHVLENIIRNAAPEVVYLCSTDPGLDRSEPFLKLLTGLVKYTLENNNGQAQLSGLAVASAQRTSTVHKGLLWLEAKGFIQILEHKNDIAILQSGTGLIAENLSEISRELSSVLHETAAYRKYYRQVAPDHLLQST